jgi:hypothetical protein
MGDKEELGEYSFPAADTRLLENADHGRLRSDDR